MNWFGKKKPTTSTVSATSTSKPSDPQLTIVKLRENIANQEKRWASSMRPICYLMVKFRILNRWQFSYSVANPMTVEIQQGNNDKGCLVPLFLFE
jgi:hypothetical protein